MSDHDPYHAELLDRIGRRGYPPSSMLDRYKKSELFQIANTWLALVKARVEDTETVLSEDLRNSDLIAIIRRLESAERRL